MSKIRLTFVGLVLCLLASAIGMYPTQPAKAELLNTLTPTQGLETPAPTATVQSTDVPECEIWSVDNDGENGQNWVDVKNEGDGPCEVWLHMFDASIFFGQIYLDDTHLTVQPGHPERLQLTLPNCGIIQFDAHVNNEWTWINGVPTFTNLFHYWFVDLGPCQTPPPSITPTSTSTEVLSTFTPTNTPANTATPTETHTASPTMTSTSTPSETSTSTMTQTSTPTNTSTPTDTPATPPTEMPAGCDDFEVKFYGENSNAVHVDVWGHPAGAEVQVWRINDEGYRMYLVPDINEGHLDEFGYTWAEDTQNLVPGEVRWYEGVVGGHVNQCIGFTTVPEVTPTPTPSQTPPPTETPVPPTSTPVPTDTPVQEPTPVVVIPEPGFCVSIEHVIFVVADDKKNTSEIYRLVNPISSTLELITWDARLDGAWMLNPSISPDGCKIVFSAQMPEAQNADLWVVGVDGTGLRQITFTDNVNEIQPEWSRDWTIPYVIDGELYVTDQWNTFVRDLKIKGVRPDTSPDGNWIAFRNPVDVLCVVNIHGSQYGFGCSNQKTTNLSFDAFGDVQTSKSNQGLMSFSNVSNSPKLVDRIANDVAVDLDGSTRAAFVIANQLWYRDGAGHLTQVNVTQPGERVLQPDWWDLVHAPYSLESVNSILN